MVHTENFVQLLFLWSISVFSAQTRGGVWTPLCGLCTPASPTSEQGTHPGNSHLLEEPGKTSTIFWEPKFTHPLPSNLDLPFRSDSHGFPLDSLQCFQHPSAGVPQPQCRIPTVGSSAFPRLFSLCLLPGFFSDLSHNALPMFICW